MPTEGRAVRIPSGPRYRLVATFAPGVDEVARDGFDTAFSAQAEVGPFVCEIAARSRPTSIRLERVENAGPAGNGKSHAPAAAVTFKRWDESVIDRILRQQSGAAPPPPAEARASDEVRDDAAAVEPDVAAAAEPDGAAAMEPDGASEFSPTGATEVSPEVAPPLPIERDEPTADGGAAPQPAPLVATLHAHRRTGHRRTRWHLILAVALVVVLTGLLLLADANGDPVGYFRALLRDSTVRESLPFHNGKPPASAPATRSAKP